MIGQVRLGYDSLLNMIIEGYMDDKTRRGRPRMEYMPQIMKDMRVNSYWKLKELSYDREAQKAVTNQPIRRLKTKKKLILSNIIIA